MLITLLIAVLILGLVLYAVRLAPIAEPFKSIAVVVVILIAIVWLLGFMPGHHGLTL
jgi:hypothetical protein